MGLGVGRERLPCTACHVPLRKSNSKNSKLELGLLDCYGEHLSRSEERTHFTYFRMRYIFKFRDVWDVGLLRTVVLIPQVLGKGSDRLDFPFSVGS